MHRRTFSRLIALIALATTIASCRKGESPGEPHVLVVFAAASAADALQDIGAAYQARTGHQVRFSFGGSSELARQIESGARADLFLSADVEKMDRLEKAGKIAPASRRDLLGNQLVVVVPLASSFAPKLPADLVGHKVATGDPQSVPIGIYARKWLEQAGAWDAVKPTVIATLDVRAALAAVESESVEAAIVYRTDAMISTKTRIALSVAREAGPRIVYPIALVAGAHEPDASAFLAEITSDASRAIFEKRGFVSP